MTVLDGKHRRSTRLYGHDYSKPGAYFVTICTCERELFFEEEAMRKIAQRTWLEIPRHFPHVELDEWIVMPNHLHGILIVRNVEKNDAPGRGVQLNAPTPSDPPKATVRDANNLHSVISPHRKILGVVIRTFKAAVTSSCREAGHHEFAWQRNYYDRVIRNQKELTAIRRYIRENPNNWETDENHPMRLKGERTGKRGTTPR